MSDISSKLLSSIIPFNRNFSELAENKPDLYGPYWISTTLILLTIILGNLSRYIMSESKDHFYYEFNFISIATLFFYGFGFGLPIFLFFLSKFIFGVSLPLISFICVYGYSFTILAPIMFLCLIPVEIVKYLVLGYGLVASTIFLVLNLFKSLEGKADKSRYIILVIVGVFQAGIYLTLSFYFFSKILVNTKK